MPGMSTSRDKFDHGRRLMLSAFVELSDWARQAGIDEDRLTELHGQFFDGNVEVKAAFGAAVLLVEIHQTPASSTDRAPSS